MHPASYPSHFHLKLVQLRLADLRLRCCPCRFGFYSSCLRFGANRSRRFFHKLVIDADYLCVQRGLQWTRENQIGRSGLKMGSNNAVVRFAWLLNYGKHSILPGCGCKRRVFSWLAPKRKHLWPAGVPNKITESDFLLHDQNLGQCY